MEDAERRGRTLFPQGAIVRPQQNPTGWRVNATQSKAPMAARSTAPMQASSAKARSKAAARPWRSSNSCGRDVPGFAKSYIVDMPPQLGIRETRRLKGAYQLSGPDVLACATFADSIGVNGWPIEAHVAGTVEWRWPEPGARGFNQLPYRMLLPQGVRNLLVAGRCASMTP